jgi:hypothetical protein
MREAEMVDVIDGALKRILACEQHQPIEILPPRLDALFRTLAETADIVSAYPIEDEIWALWTDHPDRQLRMRMDHAIAALAGRRYDEAPGQSGEVGLGFRLG